jgi:hypothetical protein
MTELPAWLAGWEVGCCARGLRAGSGFGATFWLESGSFRDADPDEPLGIESDGARSSGVRGVGKLLGHDNGAVVLDAGRMIVATDLDAAIGSERRRFAGHLAALLHGPGCPQQAWTDGVIRQVLRSAPDGSLRAVPETTVDGCLEDDYLLLFAPNTPTVQERPKRTRRR